MKPKHTVADAAPTARMTNSKQIGKTHSSLPARRRKSEKTMFDSTLSSTDSTRRK